MNIGEKIRTLRKEQKLTQKQLAEKSGIIETTIRKYEIGKQNPKIENLQKIAAALGVTVSYLLGDTDDPHMARFKMDAEININGGGALAPRDSATTTDKSIQDVTDKEKFIRVLTPDDLENTELEQKIVNGTATQEERQEWEDWLNEIVEVNFEVKATLKEWEKILEFCKDHGITLEDLRVLNNSQPKEGALNIIS